MPGRPVASLTGAWPQAAAPWLFLPQRKAQLAVETEEGLGLASVGSLTVVCGGEIALKSPPPPHPTVDRQHFQIVVLQNGTFIAGTPHNLHLQLSSQGREELLCGPCAGSAGISMRC